MHRARTHSLAAAGACSEERALFRHSVQVVLDQEDDVGVLAVLASIGQRRIRNNHYALGLDVCSHNERTVGTLRLCYEQIEAVEVAHGGVRQAVLK